jgi:hypothetical protein
MTPLAAHLAKQLVIRPKHRHPYWNEHTKILRTLLTDIHCFECSDVMMLAADMCEDLRRDTDAITQAFADFGFLPAPKTWLEVQRPDGGRNACLLIEHKTDDTDITVYFFNGTRAFSVGGFSLNDATHIHIVQRAENDFPALLGQHRDIDNAGITAFIQIARVLLCMINTPQTIGRRSVKPNAALARKLTRGFGVGKFPLHAFTEIQLRVTKPIEIDDGEPHEDYITGRRAYHFVKKYRKPSSGKLVESHWKGDPAVGIKRTRYKVTP